MQHRLMNNRPKDVLWKPRLAVMSCPVSKFGANISHGKNADNMLRSHAALAKGLEHQWLKSRRLPTKQNLGRPRLYRI